MVPRSYKAYSEMLPQFEDRQEVLEPLRRWSHMRDPAAMDEQD